MRDRAASHFFTETDAEVMLMVDHDIIWEEGDLDYIAKKCAKNKGIVAGIYPKRSMGQDIPVRFAPLSAGESRKVFFGDDVCLDADFVTTGFMAIHRDVLTALVKEMPLTIGASGPSSPPPSRSTLAASSTSRRTGRSAYEPRVRGSRSRRR